MPAEKKTPKVQQKGVSASKGPQPQESRMSIVLVVAIVAIAAVLGYLISSGLVTSGGGNSNGNFQSFQNSFYSAKRVGIYVAYNNGSAFSYTDGCATNLIQQITASRTHHRNTTTIDLLIMANATSCLTPNGPLGSANGTIVLPMSRCLAISANEPSVFINYSGTNSTIIRSGNLYTQGDALFLSECGIASELG
ncbi:MAG: hypothetical protein KGH94_03120 [Candidatus Micrarchaeota archaeon]|nr:hypothetical protein [Candidatus Micrarchaeota archaeon]